MRVQLPPTPTLAAVARDVMRASFKAPRDNPLAEWRVDGETYRRVVDEMCEFRAAIGKPLLMNEMGGLLVCGVPLFSEETE